MGYSPAPLGPAQAAVGGAAPIEWVRRLAQVLNNAQRGALNVTSKITLRTSATSTTVTDARISVNSALLLTPLTADAAAIHASIYVSSQQSGQATFAHASTTNADCTFNLLIIG